LSAPQKTTVIAISDLHINSQVAIFPRRFTMDNGDQHIPSRSQLAIYDALLDFVNFSKLKAKGGQTVVVMNGDLLEKDEKNRTNQVISRNGADIVKMAEQTIEPVVEMANRLYFVRGTEAHVGQGAEMEEIVAADLGAEKDEERGTSSWWQIRRRFGGVQFDISHHTGMGSRPWTEKNAANALAAMLVYEYSEWGERLPQVALRGHVHRVSDSGINFPIRALTMPCWTLATPYIHRMGAGNKMPHIGGFVFVCSGGEYDFFPRVYPFKREAVKDG
jgi:predicted phosphodiesterase